MPSASPLKPRDSEIELEPVSLRGQDEVILAEAANRMREDRDLGVAPTEGNVRMMALLLGQLAQPVHKTQRFDKVGEGDALARLGLGVLMMGNLREARKHLNAAKEIEDKTGSRMVRAQVYEGLL